MAPTPSRSSPLDHPMSPAFAAWFDQIEDRYDRSFLRRLFCFVSSLGVEPCDIDEAVLATFADAILAARVNRAKQVVRDAVKTSNRMAELIDGWPIRRLPLIDNRGWFAFRCRRFRNRSARIAKRS